MNYRHRIAGVRLDDPEKKRQVAYDPWPGHTLALHEAQSALWNMRQGGPWGGWTDLRVERRPVDTGWEEVGLGP